jgi:hypothetical protein
MSDYLWDKTGEPDEEVERLEELLGSFGHKPRALELPAEAAPPTSPAFSPRLFRPALLAAAALLLMALAGAALVLLRQGGADAVQQSAHANPPAAPVRENPPAPPEEPKPSAGPSERDGRAGGDSASSKEPKTPDFQAAAGVRRRRSSTGPRANREARQVAAAQRPQVAARQEPPAPTRVERQAAKEQLVYALRLASAKLGEVRKMTRGEESPRHSFNERDRIR